MDTRSRYQPGTDLARIARIVLGPCAEILRAVLMEEIQPQDLKTEFEKFIAKPNKKQTFSQHDINVINSGNYIDFSITLMYKLLSLISPLPPPKNGWGKYPNPRDRSISANIERIHQLREQCYPYPLLGLRGMKREIIFRQIAELEEYLGSYVDFKHDVRKLRACTMDPVIQHKYIEKISFDDKTNTDGDIERKMKKSNLTGPFQEGYSLQPITSGKLIRLLRSFTVKHPEDLQNESFVHKILTGHLLKELETSINSLSAGVKLNKSIPKSKRLTGSAEVWVFEVEVVCDGDELRLKKDDFKGDFFDLGKENIPRVILIRSKCISVVKAKLEVYSKYKGDIFLQHEYEEYDEVAKLSACATISSFCCYVESVVDAFTTDFSKKLKKYYCKRLTARRFTRMCHDVFKHLHLKKVVSKKRKKRGWSGSIASEIYKRMHRAYPVLCEDALDSIHKICQKTVKDLNVILCGLKEFQAKVTPVNQKKLFEDWCKLEIIDDKSQLHKYPSVIKYIIGYKGNDKMLKVYLRNDDEKTKEFFKTCWSDDTKIEFVVRKTEKKSKEIENIQKCETYAPPIDAPTMNQLNEIIEDQGEKIFARHSNVVGLEISNVRCAGDIKKEEPCIVLYSLDKTLIPFGEKPLPESIGGWPCDVREDIVMLGFKECPTNCPFPRYNHFMKGCSIGNPLMKDSGSVGFFYKSTNPTNTLGSGFLTASHVAVNGFERLYNQSPLSLNNTLYHQDHDIVHPSREGYDASNSDNKVGKVVESFLGNYELGSFGLDFAVVKCNNFREEGIPTLPIVTVNNLIKQKNVKVIKTGRTTGTREGLLKGPIPCLTVRVDKSFMSNGYMVFYRCFSVKNDTQPFFEAGDSGSGVFVKSSDGTLKPLGIAFAFSDTQTVVCQIEPIIRSLDLVIVDRKRMEGVINRGQEEPMEVSFAQSKGKKRKNEERINVSQTRHKKKKN